MTLLAFRGYKVSGDKAQIYQPPVTSLGLSISEERRTIPQARKEKLLAYHCTPQTRLKEALLGLFNVFH